MRSLLEKAVAHLLNGDDEKASALFHKFMVERARQIHENLRQNDGAEDTLDENWESEITEEEYFGDSELDHDKPEDAEMADSTADGDVAADSDVPADDMAGDSEAAPDADLDPEADADPVDAEDESAGLGDKIDDLTAKIDELTAEFDRVMSEYHDEGTDDMSDPDADADVAGDDDMADDSDMASDTDVEDMSGDDSEAGDNGDLADRMEDDMADDTEEHKAVPESEGELEEDDDLADITESVLAELDRVALPTNSEYQPVGDKSAANNITHAGAGNLPRRNVNDRVGGTPVEIRGKNHAGYSPEKAPPVKDHSTLVHHSVRKGNVRDHWDDTMEPVQSKNTAEINKDFAPGRKTGGSIIDGGKKIRN